jgi:hypothetical protein
MTSLRIPGDHERSLLERFSSSREVLRAVKGGFFLRKKPLDSLAFPLQQLDNRYSQRCSVFRLRFRTNRCKYLG